MISASRIINWCSGAPGISLLTTSAPSTAVSVDALFGVTNVSRLELSLIHI